MRLSHSRVETFKKCPYQFKLRYIDKLETLPVDDPASPLILGHALHTGIEKDAEAMIAEYYGAYPIITDRHIEEAIKLEYWLPKIKAAIPQGGHHEVEINDEENFIGFIDYLVPVDGLGTEYDLYDWKYSNNIRSYMESGQLHEYKYYFEKLIPGVTIRNMYFMFVPKTSIRIKYKNKKNKRDETIGEFRKRIFADLESKELTFVKIDYKTEKVIEFLDSGIHAINCEEYIKKPSRLCDWCEFQKLCEKGDNVDMALPSTKRRTIESNSFMKLWFYGLPFSGKTFLANKFDTPLMANTDGNFKQVDAPVLRIKDEVTTEGRITKRKYAWEVFTEMVDDLEKGSEFKTIIVDLLEDVYDACRVKVCIDNGWDHESDDSFKAYDIVRSEFLRTMKRLINLDYNIILISHEDTSRDITKKTGSKITAIKPNLQDKVALKIAGMVDICCRIINNEGDRVISFKANEVEFGGGRLGITAKEIPCEYDELMKIYGSKPVTKVKAPKAVVEVTQNGENNINVVNSGTMNIDMETATAAPVETPEAPTRARRARKTAEEEKLADEVHEMENPVPVVNSVSGEVMRDANEPAPAPRRRRRKTSEE